MRILSVSIPLLVVAAVTAGCAQTRSGSTTAMGAAPAERTVVCRDGAWRATAGECGAHGGVERTMAPSK